MRDPDRADGEADPFGAGLVPFPWQGVEERHGGVVPLCGYGSLLCADSASATIREREERVWGVAFGGRRVFDYVAPDRFETMFGPPLSSRHRAALNVRHTGRPEDRFNCALIEVPAEDLAALRVREKDYDLAPVRFAPWEDAGDGPDGPRSRTAYALACPPGSDSVDDTLLPHAAYQLLCERGAAGHSAEFHRFFLETTWLADGTTPVASELA